MEKTASKFSDMLAAGCAAFGKNGACRFRAVVSDS
jgi:hypothetical protein